MLSVIAVYGDLDRRGNVEDRIGRLCQTSLVAIYILTFRELATQIHWNKSSLIARFQGGLKDEILDSMATTRANPEGSTTGWKWHRKSIRDYRDDVKIVNPIRFFSS